MSTFKAIRNLLGLTQSALADELGVSQGNVSFYERGQTVPPAVAERLIAVAKSKGYQISYDHVYGATQLPATAEQGG